MNLISDQSNGYEQVEKLCADEERPGKDNIKKFNKLGHFIPYNLCLSLMKRSRLQLNFISGFSYREGCDTISVPFKQRECYCKQNLCNSTNKNEKVKNEVFVATISLTILSSFFFFK